MAWRTLGLKISSLGISPSSSLRRGVLCRSFVARSDGGELPPSFPTAGESDGGELPPSLPTAGESDGGELPPSLPTAGEDDFDNGWDPYRYVIPPVDPSSCNFPIYMDDRRRKRPNGYDIEMSRQYYEMMCGPAIFEDVKPKFLTEKGIITTNFGADCERWFKDSVDCFSKACPTAYQSDEDDNESRHVSTDVSPETRIAAKNFIEDMKEMAKIVHSRSEKSSGADEAAGKTVFHGVPHVQEQGPVSHGAPHVPKQGPVIYGAPHAPKYRGKQGSDNIEPSDMKREMKNCDQWDIDDEQNEKMPKCDLC